MRKVLSIVLLLLTVTLAQTTYNTLGTWDSQGVPNYLMAHNDTVKQDFVNRITAALPESVNLNNTNPQFIVNGVQSNLVLKDSAEVFVTFISEGAGYKNVLGFYTYNKSTPPTSINDIRNTMTIIFPNSSASGSGGGLVAGNKVKLGNFSANTVIGWFIIANGYSTGSVGAGNWLLFSNSNLNPEATATLRQHNVFLFDQPTQRIVLGFEDIRRDNGSCDNDFNDVLFFVAANPFAAIDTTGLPILKDPTKADLSLTKTVSNAAPADNETVTFTLTAKNNGPGDATGVKITDALPSGFEFVSATATAGSFAASTGLWTLAQLANGQTAKLDIKVKVNRALHSYNFGPATGFNVFALGDVYHPSADIEGKAAVGNNAYFSNYSVGDKLPVSNGTVDVLIVNNSLNYMSGAVYGGNVVYGNVTNLPINAVSIVDGTLKQGHPIDFQAASLYLNNMSASLKNYTTNGTVDFAWGDLTLNGTNPLLNVFSVAGSQLTQSNSMAITVPNGAVAVINITGDNINWHGGLVVNGTSINNVIYNFPDATNLKISGIDVQGSILAPKSELTYPAGVVNGQVIAQNITGSGQFNNSLFLGNIPVDSKMKNVAAITAADQVDPVLTNNQDSAIVMVSSPTNPNAGNTTGGNWVAQGNFPAGEMVWSITNDAQSNLYAGTVGGKIYKSTNTGTSWTRINSDMSAAYIWSVKETTAGNLICGTEHGIFEKKANAATWHALGLNNLDVRALAYSSTGVLFAGTWGQGIYKSVDNGSTWVQVYNQPGNLAVHGLTIAANGDMYAATFGSGVLKSADNGTTWQKLPVGFSYIWSVAAGTDAIYAGSYGNGLYRSTDNGASWSRSTSLPGQFIYGVSAVNNLVFICSWSSGVYLSVDAGNNWNCMGLGGFGPSALLPLPQTNQVLVGTGDGNLYAAAMRMTAVEGNKLAPVKFALEQNYPNPFNPSTKIDFSLAEKSHVSIVVYNQLGQVVATLAEGEMPMGRHSVQFNAAHLSSGVYFCELRTEKFSATRKLLLMK